MSITEFLLARIAEDEAVASECLLPEHLHPYGDERLPAIEPSEWGDLARNYIGGPMGEQCARHDPARVLRECAAKRAIIRAQHWEPEERPSDAELHARAAHPAYEYETTEGPRKRWDNPEEPPEGEGWEPNTAKGYRDGWARLEYTEESYWRRLKPEGERREWEPYIPRELRPLAAVYSDHPDYRQEWKG